MSVHTTTEHKVGSQHLHLHLRSSTHSSLTRASKLMTRLRSSWGNLPSTWRNLRFRLSTYRYVGLLEVRGLREWDSEGRLGRRAALGRADIGIIHFSLQNDPPAAFPKVKIQILSNWGHPRFTCLYRVRAHGVRTSEGAGDSATGDAH